MKRKERVCKKERGKERRERGECVSERGEQGRESGGGRERRMRKR